MAQRFDEQVQLGFGSPRSGAAEGLMGLSQKFGRLREQAFQERKQKVIEQETQRGLESYQKGQKPEFMDEDRLIGGVAAKAYNKGLRHAYLASLSNDVREDLATFEREHGTDSMAYQNAVQSHRAALQKEVDPTVVGQVLEAYDQNATLGLNRVRDAEFKLQRKAQLDTHNNSVQQLLDNAMISARQGDMNQSALTLKDGLAMIDSAVDAELISEPQAQEQKRKMERLATEQGWVGWAERVADEQGLEAAYKSLEDLTTKPPSGFTQPEWDSLRSDMQTAINRKKSIAQAQKKEDWKEAKAAFDDYKLAVQLGYKVDPNEKDRVAGLISGNESLEKGFGIINDTASFSVMSAAERQQVLAEQQTGQLEDVDLYASYASANGQINKAAREDGYLLGVQQGLIEQTKFDPYDPQSMSERIKQANDLSQHYGVQVSPLTVNEVKGLVSGFPQMTVKEKMELAKTMQQAPATWGQFAKQGAGTFAMAGATGDATVMESVFTGQELIDTKVAKAISSKDYLADFQEHVEGVYGAEDQRDVMNAAVAYYAANYDKTGEYSPKDFKASIDAVTGGIGEVNGYRYELPRGVDESDFNDLVEDINPRTIETLGGVLGMDAERSAKYLRNAKVVNLKSGVYGFQVNGGYLMSASDPTKPFTLEWSNEIAATNKQMNKSERLGKRQRSQR